MAKCADKVIDPAPIIKALAERCLEAKGLECSILGNVIDMLRAAPAVHNAPYWATEAAYKNGYADGKPQWIPVKERLPSNGDFVLVADSRESYANCFGFDCGWWYIDGYRMSLEEVTHWMPLPEPPEGSG